MAASLPDYIAPNLRLLSIGLNPSLPSVQAGFYFANPRNRFWPAFHSSGLTQTTAEPSANYHQILLREGIGFTDAVKRASRQGHELRSADFRVGCARLKKLLETQSPQWAWFHGLVAYRNFLKHAFGDTSKNIPWGEQSLCLGETRIFVTPNPSPANAVWSLEDLQQWYRKLARHVEP